jgi:FlaA1/EpsC-like NDP-sugar epimerase
MALKEIETNRELGLTAVGFMDDDPSIKGKKIRGYPVFGGVEDLGEIVNKYPIKEIIVSFKENSEEKKKDLTALCQKTGVEVEVKEMKLVIS